MLPASESLKRKSPGRLKSELWKTLWPELDLPTLANEISQFLDKLVGKSARNANVANNLAAYLVQKYSVANRKAGKLRWLIERRHYDLAALLDEISFKEFQPAVGTRDQLPQSMSLKQLQ